MLKTMFLLSTRRGKNIHPVQTGTEGYLSNTTGEVQKVFLFSFFAKTECSLKECTLFSALGHDGTTSTFSLVFFSIFGGTFLSFFFFFCFTSLHISQPSLWDYNAKISLCCTNCCHDNKPGSCVCKWEHKCDCVTNFKS